MSELTPLPLYRLAGDRSGLLYTREGKAVRDAKRRARETGIPVAVEVCYLGPAGLAVEWACLRIEGRK